MRFACDSQLRRQTAVFVPTRFHDCVREARRVLDDIISRNLQIYVSRDTVLPQPLISFWMTTSCVCMFSNQHQHHLYAQVVQTPTSNKASSISFSTAPALRHELVYQEKRMFPLELEIDVLDCGRGDVAIGEFHATRGATLGTRSPSAT